MELTLSGGTKVPVKRKGFGGYSSSDFSIKNFGKKHKQAESFFMQRLEKKELICYSLCVVLCPLSKMRQGDLPKKERLVLCKV